MSRPGWPRRGARAASVAAGALLLLLGLVARLVVIPGKSLTYDEVAHLPAGYSYLATGRVALNPTHPPLVKELAALPLLALGPALPIDAATLARPDLPATVQWEVGELFLVAQDARRLVYWGRVPMVLVAVGLAGLVGWWAARLWGPWGGLLSLVLCLLDPTLMAHGQLVTTDVGLAAFSVLFLLALRRFLERPSWPWLAASGVALGLALTTKFTGVLLVPVAGLLVALAVAFPESPPGQAPGATLLASGPSGTAWRRLAWFLAVMAALGAWAWITAWAVYLAPRDAGFYLDGLREVLRLHRDDNPDYEFFLMGELRRGGWPHYFLVAWLVKTPIPALLILGAAAIAFLRGPRRGRLDEAFLLVPAGLFFLVTSLGAKNIGVRYLIPCLPFLLVFAGRVAPAAARLGRWAVVGVVVLVAWMALEFAAIWPDHLSYFSQVAGGSRGGIDWLDDSNVDWGQGLLQLRAYLWREGIQNYRLALLALPRVPVAYGLVGARIPCGLLGAEPPPPGILVASAHCLARARAQLRRQHGDGPGNWLARLEPRAIVGHALYVFDIR